DFLDAEARLARLEGKRVSGQRRRDDGEAFGEQRDDVEELHDRSGPSMGQQERHGLWPTARLVDEVQLDAMHRFRELAHRIDARLVCAPVEVVLPARHEASQILEARPGGPGIERRLVRKARAREALAQIGEQCFRNMKLEGANMGNCAANSAARLDASYAPRQHLGACRLRFSSSAKAARRYRAYRRSSKRATAPTSAVATAAERRTRWCAP